MKVIETEYTKEQMVALYAFPHLISGQESIQPYAIMKHTCFNLKIAFAYVVKTKNIRNKTMDAIRRVETEESTYATVLTYRVPFGHACVLMLNPRTEFDVINHFRKEIINTLKNEENEEKPEHIKPYYEMKLCFKLEGTDTAEPSPYECISLQTACICIADKIYDKNTLKKLCETTARYWEKHLGIQNLQCEFTRYKYIHEITDKTI